MGQGFVLAFTGMAAIYRDLVPIATAQISISTITCALVLPFLVIAFDRFLRARGIDPRLEDPS